jgi:ribosomal protein S19
MKMHGKHSIKFKKYLVKRVSRMSNAQEFLSSVQKIVDTHFEFYFQELFFRKNARFTKAVRYEMTRSYLVGLVTGVWNGRSWVSIKVRVRNLL